MANVKIKVITYEESRLEHFKNKRIKYQKQLDLLEQHSNSMNAQATQEKHIQLSQAGEIVQYYDDVVKMLEADVVPKSEVEKIEKESSAFAEIIHKQEDEIQQLRKSLLTKQALEEEFSKSVKKIEKQALKTIENAKQEVAREIISTIKENFEIGYGGVCEFYKLLDDIEKQYTGSEGTNV